MTNRLLSALSQMLPMAEIDLLSERPWHSLTLSGLQLSFKAELSNGDHCNVADKFTRKLSEHVFDLPGQLVADITVTDQIVKEDHTRLTIEALLLDD